MSIVEDCIALLATPYTRAPGCGGVSVIISHGCICASAWWSLVCFGALLAQPATVTVVESSTLSLFHVLSRWWWWKSETLHLSCCSVLKMKQSGADYCLPMKGPGSDTYDERKCRWREEEVEMWESAEQKMYIKFYQPYSWMMPINKLLGQEILLVPRKVGSSLSSSSNERSVLKWMNVLLQVISSEK